MQALSHKEYGKLRNLYESVYAPERFETILEEFTDEDLEFDFTDEYIEEQVEELFIECIGEGYSIDEIENILTESIESSILLLWEDRYDSAVSASKANAQKPEVKRANRREALKKVGSAVKKVASGLKTGAKAAGKAAQGGIGLAARAVGTAQRAGERVKSAAKSGYERGRHGGGSSSGSSSSSSSGSSSGSSDGGSSSSSSSGSSDGGSSSSAPAPRKRKDGLLKRGLKKLIRGVSKGVSAAAGAVKAGADSITDRARKEQMNYKDFKSIQELYNGIYEPQQVDEENVEEVYKGRHGQSDKEYADSRSQGGKMVSGDSKQSGAEYTHGRRVKAANPGMQPDVGGKTKPKSQGKMDRGTRADLEYRKANLKKEELEATGLFSEKEIEAIMEAQMNEGLTGERYKAALKKGKQYSRRVSADPAKRATRGGRGGESDFGAGDRGSGNKAARRAGTYQEENEVEEGYKEIDAKKHGRMYDRYKKLRSAAMQDARDSGEASGTNRMKMGKMSAVIDKSSENLRKKQTKDQLTGRG